jgi:hypothetical protein
LKQERRIYRIKREKKERAGGEEPSYPAATLARASLSHHGWSERRTGGAVLQKYAFVQH